MYKLCSRCITLVLSYITIYAFSPMIVHMYSNPNPFFWPLNIISRFFLALSIGDFLLFSLSNSPSKSFGVPPPPPVNVHCHLQKRYHARHWSSPLGFLDADIYFSFSIWIILEHFIISLIK